MEPDAVRLRHDPYAALRHPDFRWYILCLLSMTLGSMIQAVVVGWQVYSITHDTLSLGLIGLAEALPFISAALPAGYLADRLNRKTLSVWALAVLVICSASLLLLSASPDTLVRTGVRPIYAIIFLSGIARSVLTPARQAMSSELVPRDILPNAIAWRSSVYQTGAVVGPAVGGLIYGFSGAVPSYAADTLLMLFALVTMVLMRYEPAARQVVRSTMLVNLLSGLRYVWNEPVILGAMSLDLFSVFLGGAEALLPVFASEILMVGPQGLGMLRAAPAVGAVSMAFYLTRRPPFARAGRMLLGAVIVFALSIIGFGLSRSFALSLILLGVSGMADSVSVNIRSTLLQILTPVEMMGRVSAVNSVFVGSSNELGAFESGVAARLLGSVRAVVAGGVAAVAVVAYTAYRIPRLRELERIG